MWCAVRVGERLVGVVAMALIFAEQDYHGIYYGIHMLGINIYFAIKK
jgi:hypothetical protein